MRKLPLPRWFHVTRLAGLVVLVFGLFFDHSPERGTIILAAMGLLGFDTVARSGSGGK